MFFKIGVLKNFAIFLEKHFCWSLLLRKLQASRLKRRLQHRCFPKNIAKFLRTPTFTEHLLWLLLPLNPFEICRKISITSVERGGGWGGRQGQRRRFVYVFPVDFEYHKKCYETFRIIYENVGEEESKYLSDKKSFETQH